MNRFLVVCIGCFPIIFLAVYPTGFDLCLSTSFRFLESVAPNASMWELPHGMYLSKLRSKSRQGPSKSDENVPFLVDSDDSAGHSFFLNKLKYYLN